MKHNFLFLLSILTITLGIKNTAQADPVFVGGSGAFAPATASPVEDRLNYKNLNSPALISRSKPASNLAIARKSNLVAIQIQSGSSMTLAALELSIHNQIDRYRQSLNLPPLIIDPAISAQARAHSREMAQAGTLSHTMDSVDLQRKYPTAAENIATTQDFPDPDRIAVQNWIASPAHQQHILGNYNLTGIGVAKNAQGEYFFTQIFINKP